MESMVKIVGRDSTCDYIVCDQGRKISRKQRKRQEHEATHKTIKKRIRHFQTNHLIFFKKIRRFKQ